MSSLYVNTQILHTPHRLNVLVMQCRYLQPLHQDRLVVLLQLLNQLRNLSFVDSNGLGFKHGSLLDLALISMLALDLLFAFPTLFLFPQLLLDESGSSINVILLHCFLKLEYLIFLFFNLKTYALYFHFYLIQLLSPLFLPLSQGSKFIYQLKIFLSACLDVLPGLLLILVRFLLKTSRHLLHVF